MKAKKRFTITITYYSWSCGDGCCSDSGYKLHVRDNETNNCLIDCIEWDYHRDYSSRKQEAVEKISEVLGREAQPSDYQVIDEHEDSD